MTQLRSVSRSTTLPVYCHLWWYFISFFFYCVRYFIRFQYCQYVPTVPKCRPNTDGILYINHPTYYNVVFIVFILLYSFRFVID